MNADREELAARLDEDALHAALKVMCEGGIDISSPRDGDLDDLELERFNTFRDSIAAYLSALRQPVGAEPVAWLPANQLAFLREGHYRQATVTNYTDEVATEPLYATAPESREIEELKREIVSLHTRLEGETASHEMTATRLDDALERADRLPKEVERKEYWQGKAKRLEAIVSSLQTQIAGKAELEWESIDSTAQWANVKPFWLQYRVTLRSDGMKQLRIEMLGNRSEDLGQYGEWEEARAIAQRDFHARLRAARAWAEKHAAPSEEERALANFDTFAKDFADTHKAALKAIEAEATPSAAPANALEILALHTNWELSYGLEENENSPSGWRVHQVNGGVNDREWTLIGFATTPSAALEAALTQADREAK